MKRKPKLMELQEQLKNQKELLEQINLDIQFLGLDEPTYALCGIIEELNMKLITHYSTFHPFTDKLPEELKNDSINLYIEEHKKGLQVLLDLKEEVKDYVLELPLSKLNEFVIKQIDILESTIKTQKL